MIETQYCSCNNLAVIKRGFSGLGAVIGIGVSLIISGFIILISIDIKSDNRFIWQALAIFLVLISPLLGTIGMNSLYSVCPKCGKITKLKSIK